MKHLGIHFTKDVTDLLSGITVIFRSTLNMSEKRKTIYASKILSSLRRTMDMQHEVRPQSGILLGYEKEPTSEGCRTMDGAGGRIAQSNQSLTTRKRLCVCTHMRPSRDLDSQRQSVDGGRLGLGQRVGASAFRGQSFLAGQ